MTARTYGGSGRHALAAVKRPDGSDMVRLVKGSPDDIRKVLWRNGVSASWMDSQVIDPSYVGRHRVQWYYYGVDARKHGPMVEMTPDGLRVGRNRVLANDQAVAL